MIDDLVLTFVLVANLARTNCHMFVNIVMQCSNWLLQRKTKEEEEEKWVDQNWETLWQMQKKKKQWTEENKENKDETEKEKDRQRKAEKCSKLTNKEKEDQRESNKEYKRKSRANRSYQKILGTRLKDWNCKKNIVTHRKESRKLVIHVRTILHQEYRERKKGQNSPFQVKLDFRLPFRNLSTTTHNKVREITDNINWLKSLSKKAVAIRTVVNSQSLNSAWAMEDAVMNSQSDEIPKLILSSLKYKR